MVLERIIEQLDNTTISLNEFDSQLFNAIGTLEKTALNEVFVWISGELLTFANHFAEISFQFDRNKRGDTKLSDGFREKLVQQLNDLRFTLPTTISVLDNHVMKFYNSTIRRSIHDHKSYFTNDELLELHHKLKNQILAESQMKSGSCYFRSIVWSF